MPCRTLSYTLKIIRAMRGGGVLVRAATNFLSFYNCSWLYNTGRVGSAMNLANDIVQHFSWCGVFIHHHPLQFEGSTTTLLSQLLVMLLVDFEQTNLTNNIGRSNFSAWISFSVHSQSCHYDINVGKISLVEQLIGYVL